MMSATVVLLYTAAAIPSNKELQRCAEARPRIGGTAAKSEGQKKATVVSAHTVALDVREPCEHVGSLEGVQRSMVARYG